MSRNREREIMNSCISIPNARDQFLEYWGYVTKQYNDEPLHKFQVFIHESLSVSAIPYGMTIKSKSVYHLFLHICNIVYQVHGIDMLGPILERLLRTFVMDGDEEEEYQDIDDDPYTKLDTVDDTMEDFVDFFTRVITMPGYEDVHIYKVNE
jgi:hypothetical protein